MWRITSCFFVFSFLSNAIASFGQSVDTITKHSKAKQDDREMENNNMENINLGAMQPTQTPSMTVSRAPAEGTEHHAEEGEAGQLRRMRGGCVPCVRPSFFRL